jgi:hypothetical protein
MTSPRALAGIGAVSALFAVALGAHALRNVVWGVVPGRP